jgi:GAF domain-containing protein
MRPPKPANESKRLAALRRYHLNPEREASFDRITEVVARVLDVPMALISLIDAERQWFKSCLGLEATETNRDEAFCAHAILYDEPLIVGDATADARFADNPFVLGAPHIRFYAGAPLRTPDG